MKLTPLEEARLRYQPKRPAVLAGSVHIHRSQPPPALDETGVIRTIFPHTFDLPLVTLTPGKSEARHAARRIGVILSGGPAPGGHNVIGGLFDALMAGHPESALWGFLGGPAGLLNGSSKRLTREIIDSYRNTGGFDIIGSGRTKLESDADFDRALAQARELDLDGIVVVGGDDSNTNACALAEHALEAGSPLQVVGVPKTIDGDLKSEFIEASFGFDTACKVYSELIGNIQRDASSSLKYWHFIKLMGRSASHITLECALQTHPNIALISEEIAAGDLALHEIVDRIAEAICARAGQGEHFGTVLIPEGLIEFIPEVRKLIAEINDVLSTSYREFEALHTFPHKREFVAGRLSPASTGLYRRLPREIATQLILDRDPHGNVQVARVETDFLLIEMVGVRLKEWQAQGRHTGAFSAQRHFFGYEGRCASPSNFDADYCYALGATAAHLLSAGLTGYIATIRNLAQPAAEWIPGGVPLARLMTMERRHGSLRPVIQKCLVDLEGPAFADFVRQRDAWAVETHFRSPGPLQYFGPPEVCDRTTLTLGLESAHRAAPAAAA